MMVSGDRRNNTENMATIRWSPEPRTPAGGPHHNHRPPNLEYQTFASYHVSQHATSITLMTMKDDLEQRAWTEEPVLVSSPVKSESQWPYSAQHIHREHTHNIHVEHKHNTPRTHRENTHSTQTHTTFFMGVE